MKIKFIVICFLFFPLHHLIAQKPVDITSQLDKRNFSVILNASAFLKDNKNVVQNFNDTVASAKTATVYDSLIKSFFDLSYLKDSMKDETNSFEARLGLQKAILYNIDYFLDILPPDSLWLSPLKSTPMTEDVGSYPPNTLVAYFPLANEPFYAAVILFNERGKIFAVSPLIHFEKRKNPSDIEQFYRRHNYNKINDKLWRP
jgi:hypothetical protein